MGKKGIIVIDPGHGGQWEVGGSSPNNAVSSSGVLEKNITLRLAFLTRDAILRTAAADGHTVSVILTRDDDSNLSLRDRASHARKHKADLFLSIHCNAFDGAARGVETLIRTKKTNSNHAADKQFAQAVQKAALGALRAHDPATPDRKVKDQLLGVLKDAELGPKVRACLLEVEFIDVKAVDQLLNIGPNAPDVRRDLANAIAGALIGSL